MGKAHRSIEFRHLRYFLAAAEQGSFRKAGLALGVQESTISRCIRDLEDNLGASLFHRHSAGVRLTFAGQRFLQRARDIDRQIGESGDDVAMIGRAEMGVVRVGLFSSLSSGFHAEHFGGKREDVDPGDRGVFIALTLNHRWWRRRHRSGVLKTRQLLSDLHARQRQNHSRRMGNRIRARAGLGRRSMGANPLGDPETCHHTDHGRQSAAYQNAIPPRKRIATRAHMGVEVSRL
ncbi:LysR family transcriptional regulator [Mesorhizobium sp. PL10]